jgi:long-subunit fatty acid transport protein
MRRFAAGACFLLVATTAQAQTNDHFFRSWRWTREEGSARAAALGGAALALADDSVAARDNPAALTSLSRTEIAVHLLRRGSATTPAGDSLAGGATLGSFSVGARLGTRLAAGLYAADTRHARIAMAARPLPDGLTDEGGLEVRVREAGLAAAWQIAGTFHAGGRLSLGYASVSGEYRREAAGQPTRLRVGTGGSDARLTGALGAVWQPAERLRLAFAAEKGNAWTLDRTAVSPWLDVTLDSGSTYRLRQPSVLGVGASIRLSRKAVAFGQADHVRYSEIQSALIIRQGAHSRDDYRLADAWEPRAGLEVSLPFTKVSLQLRTGIERLAEGGLAYQGRDVVEQAAFPGSAAQVGWTAGAALVTGSFRLDAAARGAGERPAFLAGLTARF